MLKLPPESRLLPSTEDTALEDLLKQVAIEYSSDSQLPPLRIEGAEQFGSVYAFSKGELDQLGSLRDLVVDFVLQPTPPRPLCLAVFGPPGSGKSFAAEQVSDQAEGVLDERAKNGVSARTKLNFEPINLTQVANKDDLARVLARIASAAAAQAVPVVFFDEFDAAIGSAPYGWLSWFLAPMHDEASCTRALRYTCDAPCTFSRAEPQTRSQSFRHVRRSPLSEVLRDPIL